MKNLKITNIAVLITCHNRRNKTLASLDRLYVAAYSSDFEVDVYLVDDGSTDGTGEAVKTKFPHVTIIQGDGQLYWSGGMRLAWEMALQRKIYNYFLWLNDDTMLFDEAISEMVNNAEQAKREDGKPALIVGSCLNTIDSQSFSYGGRNKSGPVIPNGKLQPCTLINGNAVLVPFEIYQIVGNISEDYTHSMGDFDYGLRVIRDGFNCYVSREFIAVCKVNDKPAWQNPKTPFMKRWKLLHSPKGLNIIEYNKFRKKFWGNEWILFALKAYLKTLFPGPYNKLSKK
ncbi:MAG TPA: glycosyltransferase family 2 protein [Prolixibacteraceae bacterium]|nr:glycosyltransferase family 2 protein [Prolixibacteraceae bacterium]